MMMGVPNMLIYPLLICILAINQPKTSHYALAQQQDPKTLNGGSIMAMAGKNCVAVAVDKRFGSGAQMVNVSPRTVLIPHSSLVVAFAGLEGDVQSLAQDISTHVSTKMGRYTGFGFGSSSESSSSAVSGSRAISPESMSTLLSHLLYQRRSSPFYVEPIIAGLEKVSDGQRMSYAGENGEDIITTDSSGYRHRHVVDEGKHNQQDKSITQYRPFICAQDLIGAQSNSPSFACAGAASQSLYGTAEAMWRPNLEPEELVQVCGRAFLSALERDCLSGYGAIIYLLVGGQGIVEYDLACRND